MVTLDECKKSLEDAPNCLVLLRAWLRWRGDDLVPRVENVRPEDLGAALASVSVLEISSADHVTYRLAGGLHAEALGKELRGENLVELLAPEEQQAFVERARRFLAHPNGRISDGRLIKPNGSETAIRTLALPVTPRSADDPPRAYMALDTYGASRGPFDDPIAMISLDDEYIHVDIGYGPPD